MMGRLARQLEIDRSVRNAARGAFDQRLAQVRQDLDARGVGGRIADKLGEDAHEMFDEAVEIANQNRGIMAGTIAAVAVWIFRNPLLAWIEALLGGDLEEANDEQVRRKGHEKGRRAASGG